MHQRFPALYHELRHIAHRHLSRRRPGQTLNTTALVHEAYLRLSERADPCTQDPAHFQALASRAMRFILVDYVRTRMAEKRGGGAARLPLEDLRHPATLRDANLLALDEALTRLARHSERLNQVVEHHFFGGFSFVEIAEATGRSERTVRRDWQKARLWLRRALQETPPPS